MAFFQTKYFDVDEVEKKILSTLNNRPIIRSHEADLLNCHNIARFFKRYYSRPSVRLKIILNKLPPCVYAIFKVFPFYKSLRKQLLINSTNKKAIL